MFDFIGQKLSQVFSNVSKGKKDYKQVEKDIFNIFMDADVPFEVAQSLSKSVLVEFQKVSQNALKGTVKASEQLQYSVYKVLEELFNKSQGQWQGKSVVANKFVLLCGPVGSGKTTSAGKLALDCVESFGFSKEDLLLVSIDSVRSAGADQLDVLAKRIGVSFVDLSGQLSNLTPANPVFKSKKIVVIDTPGQWAMSESGLKSLGEVCSGLGKALTKVCVIDSMMGQFSMTIVSSIAKVIDIDCAVLTKVDSEAKGGAAVGFALAIGKPIAFTGDGEALEDCSQFVPKQFVQRLLGSGDIDGLEARLAKSFKKITQNESSLSACERLMDKVKSDNFDFDALMLQIQMMQSFGPISKIAAYLPGSARAELQDLDQKQAKFTRYKIIIQSMTPKERNNPKLMKIRSRCQRIARGSGVSMEDFDEFLKEFAKMEKNIKMYCSSY